MTTVRSTPAQMKAIVYTEHGPPDVLKLSDIPVPLPKEDQILIRVRAAAVNPLDWHLLRGEPSFIKMMARGKQHIPGFDIAGQVEAVGARVRAFRPGDEVFGSAWGGGFAEYVCGKEVGLAHKPAGLTFEQAAAISVAGKTALQALRDHGRVQPGQRVLIVGAAGGVGTFAVQIAKALGAEVTGVCSTRNVEFVRSLGAQHVVDYTAEDPTATGRRYDVVVQAAGSHKLAQLRRATAPRGTIVLVGGGTGRNEHDDIGIGDMLGTMARSLAARAFPWLVRQPVRFFMTKGRRSDLLFLKELIETGKLTPVIDRTYPLAEAAEAIRYVETGHVRGKVVVTV